MTAAALDPAGPVAAEGFRSAALRLMREKPLGAVGAAVFLFFLVCAAFAYPLAPYGENQTEIFNRLQPPSADHILGTDKKFAPFLIERGAR